MPWQCECYLFFVNFFLLFFFIIILSFFVETVGDAAFIKITLAKIAYALRDYINDTTHVLRGSIKRHNVNCSVPQGSVLGPLKFIAYTFNQWLKNTMWTYIYLQSVVEEHNVDPYLYADDSHLNDQILLSDVCATIPKMENCVDAVHKWCAFKRLQLNPSETKVIWFGTNTNLKKL